MIHAPFFFQSWQFRPELKVKRIVVVFTFSRVAEIGLSFLLSFIYAMWDFFLSMFLNFILRTVFIPWHVHFFLCKGEIFILVSLGNLTFIHTAKMHFPAHVLPYRIIFLHVLLNLFKLVTHPDQLFNLQFSRLNRLPLCVVILASPLKCFDFERRHRILEIVWYQDYLG